ncbi:MAG: hypothetical protein HZA93_18325 [Verrucomicrobia bacterium]|nr:hypothetical protein [Verrucomicrobiota bacterium]
MRRSLLALAAGLGLGFAPALSAQTWSLDPSFAPTLVLDDANIPVSNLRLLPTPTGQFLVLGNFNRADGVAAAGLVRLNADLTLDRTFVPEITTNETPLAVAPLSAGRVLLAVRQTGGFEDARFSSADRVYRLRADGRKDPDFPRVEISGTFNLVPLPGGRAFAYGTFRTYAGFGHRGVIRLLDDGTADRSFITQTSVDDSWTLAPGPADTLAVSDWSSAGSFSFLFVNRLRADGSIDPTFTPAVREGFPLLAMQPDGAIVACAYGNRPVCYWPDGSLSPTYARHASLANVRALVPLSGGRVAVQSNTDFSRGPSNPYGGVYVLTLEGEIETDLRRAAGTTDQLGVLAALPDDRLLLTRAPLGPNPTSAVPPTNRTLALASADGRSLTPFPTALAARYEPSVSAIAIDATGRAIVQGDFIYPNRQSQAFLTRLLPGGVPDPSFPRDAGNFSLTLALPDGGAIVRSGSAGYIAADGTRKFDVRYLRWRADGTTDWAFSFPASLESSLVNWVTATPDGRLLVAVRRTSPNPAQLTGSSLVWLAADGRILDTLPPIFSLVGLSAQPLADGRLLVAGGFTRVDGTPWPYVARLLASGELDRSYTAPALPLDQIDSAQTLPDGRAVVFGRIWVNGVSQPRALRLRADGSLDPDYLVPVTRFGSRLLPDGSFVTATQRFTPDGALDLNFTPLLVRDGAPGTLGAAALGPDGALWVGGRFSEIAGVAPRPALARFLPAERVAITVAPADITVAQGATATLRVGLGTARPATYQWTRDGVPVPGATRSELEIVAARPEAAGTYRVSIAVAGQTLVSPPAAVTVARNTTRLVNISARTLVTPAAPLSAGFVRAGGDAPQPILLRAVGQGLQIFQSTMLRDPVLTLRDGARIVAQDRGGVNEPAIVTRAQQVGAFPMDLSQGFLGGTLGSGLALNLGGGAFTFTAASGDGGSGVCLLEYYDAAPAGTALAARNLSVLAPTGLGNSLLTAGFVVAGNGPLRVLVRGLGPVLASFGVNNAISDPALSVYPAGEREPFATNAGWANDATLADAARRVGAFALPAGSRDTAVLLTLDPGAYLVQLASARGATGTGMIELYVVDF